jgi:hypothetical protein
VRTMKIFAGRNTKTVGIKPRIVLRASAIGKCELTVLLIARGAGEYYWRSYGRMREAPFGGYNKGNNN